MRKKIILSKEYREIHKDNERLSVAEIDISFNDDELFEERTEGFLNIKNHGKCKICVYTNEGPNPHFHIEDKDLTFICCIRLDKPEYFKHGIKRDKINNKDIKELIRVLNSKSQLPEFTVFEALCIGWNLDGENPKKIKKPYKMPDYTKLNDKE